jgi:hypothetical protein
MNYRFDSRSKDKFKKDIKEASKTEEEILNLWLDVLAKDGVARPVYSNLAAGRDGKFLKDKDVDSTADFVVEGHGKVEVKFCNPFLKTRFHLKVGQLKSYIKQGCKILIVNGWETDAPVFTIINPDMIQKIITFCEVVKWQGFGAKPAYRVPTEMFIWRPLK